jgi:hypothetical protein
MKLHELQTVDDDLPFDVEVALRAFANGRTLYLADDFFSDQSLKVRHVTRTGDGFTFNVSDSSSSHGYRDLVYGAEHVDLLKLSENELGVLVLTYTP